ncbi:MAG TPA: ATP-binding protein [Verrucomicrobiae bacterium]|nr:ATP-binding protein [Verrucomicrobiae bacterium]
MKTSDPDPPKAGPPNDERSSLERHAFAVGATALAFLVRWALDPVLGDKYPFATFVIALTFTAWHGGFGPSLVSFSLGFLLADWFFVEPAHSYALVDKTHIGANLFYFFVSLSIILLGRSMHAARRRANASAAEAARHQSQLEQEVAERKRDEEEARRLNSELEKRVVERTMELMTINQELESFTYSVSHDLRAPLRHVDGYAQILEEEFAPQLPDEARRYTFRIREGSQRMTRLVEDLLNLSRVGKHGLNREKIDLTPWVEGIVDEIKPETTGRKIEWRIGPLPAVECDTGLMKQALVNLLANAVKYTRPRAEALIEIGQIQSNGENVIFVRDNGVGFDMKYAGKLFGVFQRLHRAEEFEGTGVGLATVARIIRKHGGKIWAEAEPDQGAVFYFTLGGKTIGKRALDLNSTKGNGGNSRGTA